MSTRPRSRLPRAAAAAIVLCAASVSPAFAHALLRKASPGVGSTVHTPPAEIGLVFSEGVEPSLCRVIVIDAAGTEVETGEVHTAPDNPKQLFAGLKPIGPGAYTVEWHATSVETHKTDGRFLFTVVP